MQDAGWIGWMIKPLGRWSLIMEIDEGFAVGMSPAELSAEQLLSKLWLWEGKAERYGWGSNSTQEAQFSVIDAITASEYKTKTMANMLKALGSDKKALVVLSENDAKVVKSMANIPGVKTALVNTVNVYDVLNCDKFIVVKSAAEKMEEVYA